MDCALTVCAVYGLCTACLPAKLRPYELMNLFVRTFAEVQHIGEDCWASCGAQQGLCSWCGTGYCCRFGWDDHSNGCDGSIGIDGAGHVCSTRPSAGVLRSLALPLQALSTALRGLSNVSCQNLAQIVGQLVLGAYHYI